MGVRCGGVCGGEGAEWRVRLCNFHTLQVPACCEWNSHYPLLLVEVLIGEGCDRKRK